LSFAPGFGLGAENGGKPKPGIKKTVYFPNYAIVVGSVSFKGFKYTRFAHKALKKAAFFGGFA